MQHIRCDKAGQFVQEWWQGPRQAGSTQAACEQASVVHPLSIMELIGSSTCDMSHSCLKQQALSDLLHYLVNHCSALLHIFQDCMQA